MRPDFFISGLSANANDRLLSLTVTDEAGIKSDTCRITLDDRDYKLIVPTIGQQFTVEMGYKETGLTHMGLFEVDEVRVQETQAKTMEITARAQFHTTTNIKKPITQPWDEKTLGEIISTLAGRNGYSVEIDAKLGAIWYDHLDQTEESDIHLASRLAEQHDAYAKITDGKMLFKPRGVTNGSVTIEKTEGTHVTATLSARSDYTGVKAWWDDVDSGQRKEEVAGGGEKMFEIRQTFTGKPEAERTAAAKLEQLRRGTAQIDNLTIPGNPAVKAEMKLILVGFRPEVNGEWITSSVTHTIDGSGFKTVVKCENDKEKKKGMNRLEQFKQDLANNF